MPLLESEVEQSLFEKGYTDLDDTFINWLSTQVKINGFYIDMLGVSDDGLTFYVAEIKKDEVDGNALSQLLNYMETLKSFLKQTENEEMDVKGVLIGTHLSSHMQLAINALEDIRFCRYESKVSLNERYWAIKTEVFEEESTKKQIGDIMGLVDDFRIDESDEEDE